MACTMFGKLTMTQTTIAVLKLWPSAFQPRARRIASRRYDAGELA